MVSSKLLSLIRCPVTLESLTAATDEVLDLLNSEIAKGQLFNQLGIQLEHELEEGLVNQTASCFIIVRQGIPELSPDQTIPIDHLELSRPTQESAKVWTDE